MPQVIAQEVSVLSSSRHVLIYLTPNDWMLVADKASRASFRKGQTLIYRGKKSNGVYLLVKGVARVQIPSQASAPEIGPGEVCGEMSFLDDVPASANVIAMLARRSATNAARTGLSLCRMALMSMMVPPSKAFTIAVRKSHV